MKDKSILGWIACMCFAIMYSVLFAISDDDAWFICANVFYAASLVILSLPKEKADN